METKAELGPRTLRVLDGSGFWKVLVLVLVGSCSGNTAFAATDVRGKTCG